jgi:uncharacterized protein (TIGR02598 family)
MRQFLPTRRPAAFTLVEVTVALGVAAFCLLAIFGLMHSGLVSEKATIGQTVANDLLSTVFADLRATPATETSSQVFKLPLTETDLAKAQTLYFDGALKPTGTLGASPTADSRYRATVGIKAPATGVKAPTLARIVVSWPAAADPDPKNWPGHAEGRVEVLSALDR